MKGVIIQGSARSDGNTKKMVQLLLDRGDFDFIDLNQKKIGHFHYEFMNKNDDFLPLMREITAGYDLLIFATPIYWYTMSGIMKAFFDRISDCLKTDKEIGRMLRGKKMAMLCCGSEKEETEGFNLPFKFSAEYLGMNYLGDVHTWADDNGVVEQEVVKRIDQFAQLIL